MIITLEKEDQVKPPAGVEEIRYWANTRSFQGVPGTRSYQATYYRLSKLRDQTPGIWTWRNNEWQYLLTADQIRSCFFRDKTYFDEQLLEDRATVVYGIKPDSDRLEQSLSNAFENQEITRIQNCKGYIYFLTEEQGQTYLNGKSQLNGRVRRNGNVTTPHPRLEDVCSITISGNGKSVHADNINLDEIPPQVRVFKKKNYPYSKLFNDNIYPQWE